ncbi:permease prefix domain 1-containing protein [Salibacterium aidingense]|uniref:permease prefix domain 1-containing protein n=1 Tax=Salibacterium aidingense TaxID=384933 RepID=UPI003BBF2AD7
MRNNQLDRRVRSYVDDLFAGVGESQQLYELKEELSTNLKEKIGDYKKEGRTEDEAFKEAAASIGDLSGLVDDMRDIGEDKVKQSVYSSMTNRISTAGLIIGVLLALFGALVTLMLYFMELPPVSTAGPAIFIVIGCILITYSSLTRETTKKFAMNKIRAMLYTAAAGLILFGFYTAVTSGFATGEMFIAVSSMMVFLLAGVGLWLGLVLTGRSRLKGQ